MPEAPTSMAERASLRVRSSGKANAVSVKQTKGRAAFSQSAAVQYFKNRNCDRSRTTSTHAGSITVTNFAMRGEMRAASATITVANTPAAAETIASRIDSQRQINSNKPG